MSKKMLVNATHPEENRVAIVEDGILTELDIEVAGREPTKGNIYKAVVVRVETGLQAAFVDYGAERLGFLQIDEINYTTVKPDYKSADDVRRPRINDLLHRGQELLVQITKEERGTKGAALTTYLSLAGRYMVLMPGSQTRGVSRKAESDSQRKELKKAMSSIDMAEGIGYIVRTAALDQAREELERDYRYLIRLYESIKELEQKSKAPAIIYKESNLMIRSIRDYFTSDMDEVMIDDPQVFKEAKDFFELVMPDQVKLVKLHQERRPIFSRYQIEDQIETLSRNKVTLPSGGSIVIDPTEALVAIDVNSGKMASEQNVEATATKTNLEAATEVGRQLRLRDLGGLIVIDFIDMRERKNMRQVEDQVKKSLENDKARVSVGRISKFGLLELSRQRIKAALTQASHLPCPHCNGTGQLKSPESQAVALLRKIHASAAKGQVGRIDAQLPMEVAAYLLNNSREELVDMERRHQLQIHIHGNRDFLADQVEIEIHKKEKEKAPQVEYVEAGNVPMALEKAVIKEVEEPVEEGTVATETEPGKKRRRRRRRKPAAEGVAVGVPASGQDLIETQESAQDTEKPEMADTPDETSAEQAGQESPAKKPQQRRRSNSRTKAAELSSETTESALDLETALAEAPATTDKPESAAAEAQDVVATKPKRRRSRRKPRTVGDKTQVASESEVAEQIQSDTTTEPNQKPAAEPLAEVRITSAAQPKPQRPRHTNKKPESKPETPETALKQAVEQAKPEHAVTEMQPAARKPARRTRAKISATQAVQETTPVTENKPGMARTETETADKPKRRQPSLVKPTPKLIEKATVTAAATETKPAVKKLARKVPARKTAPVNNSGEAAPAKGKKADSPIIEKAKPKRTRTVKKKPVEADPV